MSGEPKCAGDPIVSDNAETEYARRALLEERALVAPRINALRLIALAITTAVMTVNRMVRQDSIGPSMPLLAVWLAAAATLFALTRQPPRRARASIAFIPLVDMPLLFVLFHQLVTRLGEEGVGQDAPASAVLAAIVFALLVFLTGGLVERWQTAATATIATSLQLALNFHAGVDSTVSLTTVMSLFFVAALTAASSGRVLSLVSSAVAEQRRRERLNRYFSPQVVEHLEASTGATAAAESREATVLFADLRGFTALTEQLPGIEVVELLNRFHETMVEVLFRHGGTLDKYLGDGLMAYFGAPLPDPHHPHNAVLCARAMQQALQQLNRERQRDSQPALRMGIGVHTGNVIIGDIGASSRREFTAIGHNVNVAARLQEMTKSLGVPILVSQSTRERSDLEFESAGAVEVRGLTNPIEVFMPRQT